MAQSKLEKERKEKRSEFKETAKKEAAQKAIPKTHLIPQTNWESTDNLDLRGDLLEALEEQMLLTFQNLRESQKYLDISGEHFNKTARVVQAIMQTNVKAGKVKLTYEWNNGEVASEEDVATYEARVAQLREEQLKQVEKIQSQNNAEKTGLVGLDGSPIGTSQDLKEDQISDESTNEA